MKTNNQTIFALSRPLFLALLALNLGLLLWLKLLTDNFLSWNAVDLNKESLFQLKSLLAIAQFALVGLSLDQILRKAIIGFNVHSESSHVPAILAQVLTVTIFIVTGIAAYIGLYDHHLNYLFASIGALSVGILYILKDVGHQVICGITLQADRIVSVDDWLEVKEGGATEYLQVVELDYRMVVLRNDTRQLIRVYNHHFSEMHFINLSKQKPGVAAPRKLEFRLSSANNPERVRHLFNLVQSRHRHRPVRNRRHYPFSPIPLFKVCRYQSEPAVQQPRTHEPQPSTNSLARLLWTRDFKTAQY